MTAAAGTQAATTRFIAMNDNVDASDLNERRWTIAERALCTVGAVMTLAGLAGALLESSASADRRAAFASPERLADPRSASPVQH